MLESYKKFQQEQINVMGDRWNKTDRIFTQWDGKQIHPQTPTKWFSKFIKKYDLPKISIHSLRHTHATLMISKGIDIKTVSKRMGHSDISTTLDIYAHALQSADAAAGIAVGDILLNN